MLDSKSINSTKKHKPVVFKLSQKKNMPTILFKKYVTFYRACYIQCLLC